MGEPNRKAGTDRWLMQLVYNRAGSDNPGTKRSTDRILTAHVGSLPRPGG
jgi:hypothetical protein